MERNEIAEGMKVRHGRDIGTVTAHLRKGFEAIVRIDHETTTEARRVQVEDLEKE